MISFTDFLYYIEYTPQISPRAECHSCYEQINPHKYRLAVCRKVQNPTSIPTADIYYYHIICFERDVQILDIDFLERLEPLTQFNLKTRGLSFMSKTDPHHIVPAGIERLVREWVAQRIKWMHISHGREVPAQENTPLIDLWYNAGSHRYRGHHSDIPNIPKRGYMDLLHDSAPWEHYGPDDSHEWNLFSAILEADTLECLDNRYSLSEMVDRWTGCVDASFAKEEELTEILRQTKDYLGPAGVRAIKRLSRQFRYSLMTEAAEDRFDPYELVKASRISAMLPYYLGSTTL